MKRGVGRAMPTQHIVATNGIVRPAVLTDLRDLMGIPRIPVAKTIQPEIVIDLERLEEIDISKTSGIKRELLIIARNRTIRQLQKNIDDLVNGDQTQSELQKFRKIQDTLKRVKAIDPTWKVKLNF
jgi:hypothetical protein